MASAVSTVAGFGVSTVMMPILLFFFPLPQALLLVGIIHFFQDAGKMLFFKSGANWRLILGFGLPGILGAYVGARLVFVLPQEQIIKVLGAIFMVYVIFVFLNPQFKLRQNSKNAGIGGLLYGTSAGVFGIGGEIRAAFLSAFDLKKTVYIFTNGAIGFAVNATRVSTYIYEGTRLPEPLLWGLFIFIPAAFVGVQLGKWAVDLMPQKYFRPAVALFLLAVGIRLAFF